MPKRESSPVTLPRRQAILPARYRSPQSQPGVSVTAPPPLPPRAATLRRYPFIDPRDRVIREQRQLIEEKKQLIDEQRQLIEEKDSSIETMKGRIRRLEQLERRLRKQLDDTKDKFAEKAVELGEVRGDLRASEEKLEEKEETVRGLIREVHLYQGWWINEYHCLKVALKLARNQQDKGVKAMRESSNARFMTWSGSHAP